ncbi:hypothetical protein [Burkholderia ambifaria]|jgi:hypothetical protein|uniref:hypothetical protein n=1 Tax=Burkholderia ambifaria TaxID=152480 RepID=UPI0015891DC6|nr:hypothetical protein [Burkholderia ambifaria]
MNGYRLNLTHREICDYLQRHPGANRPEIQAGTAQFYDDVRERVEYLIKAGYVRAEACDTHLTRFYLTGKPHKPVPARKATDKSYLVSMARATARAVTDGAVYAMVARGRAS